LHVADFLSGGMKMMNDRKKLSMLSAAVMTALVLGSGVALAAETEAQDSIGDDAVYRSNLEMSDDQLDALFADVTAAYGNGDAVLLSDDQTGKAVADETETDKDSKEETNGESNSESDTKTGTESDAKSDSESDTKADTESDSKTNTKSDTKSDTTAGTTTSGNTDAASGQMYDSLNERMNNLEGKINRVGAGAAALAALHPETFTPGDKWSFAVGYGHYKNANAGAIGAFYKPNMDTTVSLGSTIGNGSSMLNAGVSFKLGSHGVMTATGGIDEKDFLALKAENEEQTKEIKAQRQELNEQRKALDVLRSQMLRLLQGLKKH
jgi:hypothetical protein